eukprot:7934567-Pyramimonas_sp.AAC.1
MKALGAALDLETDSLYLKRLGLTIPMSETVAGHYEIDFLNREKKAKRQVHASSVRVRDVLKNVESPPALTFQ